MKKKILTTVAALCAVCFATAQVPQGMNYQALVKNADNSIAANQVVGVQVTIQSAAAAVYKETQTITTDATGSLNMAIGTGVVVDGNFSAIDWANGDYVLTVALDPRGGESYTMTTEQTLLSVPYALYTQNAADAFSRDYNDLNNKPVIPTVPENISTFANDAKYITSENQKLSLSDDQLSIDNGVDGKNVNTVTIPLKADFDYNNVVNRPMGSVAADVLMWDNDAKAWTTVSSSKGKVMSMGEDGKPQFVK